MLADFGTGVLTLEAQLVILQGQDLYPPLILFKVSF